MRLGSGSWTFSVQTRVSNLNSTFSIDTGPLWSTSGYSIIGLMASAVRLGQSAIPTGGALAER